MSRALLAQVTQYRIASFNGQSQRYVPDMMFDYVLPPEIDRLPKVKEEFVIAMQDAQRHYDSLARD